MNLFKYIIIIIPLFYCNKQAKKTNVRAKQAKNLTKEDPILHKKYKKKSDQPVLEGSSLATPSLNINDFEDIGGNIKPNVLINLDNDLGRKIPDYIRITACPIDLGSSTTTQIGNDSFYCQKGIKAQIDVCSSCPGIQVSTVLPGLSEGSWSISAKACLYEERALDNNKLCGLSNEENYIQSARKNNYPLLQAQYLEITSEFEELAKELNDVFIAYDEDQELCTEAKYQEYKKIPEALYTTYLKLSTFEQEMSLADNEMQQISYTDENGEERTINIIDGIPLNGEVKDPSELKINKEKITLLDSDGDGIPNNADDDDDNDGKKDIDDDDDDNNGIKDTAEDKDRDGILDHVDQDDNNDGRSDKCDDFDLDGVFNLFDDDDDNDGIPDSKDDSDGDGVLDLFDLFLDNPDESKDKDKDCIGDNEEKEQFYEMLKETSLGGLLLAGGTAAGISLFKSGIKQTIQSISEEKKLNKIKKDLIDKVDNLFGSVKEKGRLGTIMSNLTQKNYSHDLNRKKLKEFLTIGIEEGESEFKSILKNQYKLKDPDTNYLWQKINQNIKALAKTHFDGKGLKEIDKLSKTLQGKSLTKSDNLMKFITKGVNQVPNLKNKGGSKEIQTRKIAGLIGIGLGAAVIIGVAGPDSLGENFLSSAKETLEQSDDFELVGSHCTDMIQSVTKWLEITKTVQNLRENRTATQRKIQGTYLELELQKRNQ